MGTYAVTGSASGMGAATAERLRAEGHTVIGVDIVDADVVADLATPAGRRTAAEQVLERSRGVLDGAVMAAGVGPAPGPERARLILQVNFVSTVDLLEAWRPALAASDRAKVVVFASNSTTTMPMLSARAIRALLEGETEVALARVRRLRAMAPAAAYGVSKVALSRWVRRRAVTAEWAGTGIRLNALAPGAVRTPLLEEQLDSPGLAKRVKAFPVPLGGFGEPDDLAAWAVFMLSDAADFLCGSVLFVDGGTDAWFRADDWPRPVPARHLRRYLARMRSFRPPRDRRVI